MPTRIRLQRHGKKGRPFYHIVIADGRAPRDGKFIERIGTYNPLTIPAEINIDFEKALSWVQKGAQPSETAKNILIYKGVMYKNHLLKGVAKNAFTLEEAEIKFQAWLKEREAKISNKKNQELQSKKDAQKKRHEAESKVNIAKANEVAKKRAQQLAKDLEASEQEVEAAVEENPVNEAAVDTQAEVANETPAENTQEATEEKSE